jgi:hypothetical protein
VIEIRTDDYPANIEYLPTGHGTECSDICWETKSPPPPALLVCQESREEALKVYNIAFELQPFGSQIIYINAEFDIVFPFIDKWTEMLEILLEDIRAFDPSGRGARRLALEIALFAAHYSPSFGNPTKQRITAAHRLDEVIVIVGASPEVWAGDYVLVTPSTDAELYLWEEKAETARECFENAMRGRYTQARLSMLAFRERGQIEDVASGSLQGPKRTWEILHEET